MKEKKSKPLVRYDRSSDVLYIATRKGLEEEFIEVALDCAPPVGEFSPRFEGGATGSFGFLNLHLVFLRG